MIADIPEIRWAATVDGASIAYQDFGQGPVTLVVIHGVVLISRSTGSSLATLVSCAAWRATCAF